MSQDGKTSGHYDGKASNHYDGYDGKTSDNYDGKTSDHYAGVKASFKPFQNSALAGRSSEMMRLVRCPAAYDFIQRERASRQKSSSDKMIGCRS